MPKRWTIEEENQKRKELIELYIHQNKTIGEISKILRIAQQTVFDRMKRLGIPIIPENKPHYLNKKRDELSFPSFSDKLAEFVGIMLGDGNISSGQIRISLNSVTDRKYSFYIQRLLKSLFKVSTGVYQRKNQQELDLFISSVDLIDYLREKGLFITNKVKYQVDVPSWIFNKDSYKKSFLRGFFDTDGSIYLLRYGVQMAFNNRSYPLLSSTKEILLNLGYHPSAISSNKVYLTRKPDLRRYANEIGFGNSNHSERAKKFGII
jgi:intein/homing endonuclease